VPQFSADSKSLGLGQSHLRIHSKRLLDAFKSLVNVPCLLLSLRKKSKKGRQTRVRRDFEQARYSSAN
jgi:hypothetical protein